MRFFSAFIISSPPRFKSNRNVAAWHRSFSNSSAPPIDQPPMTNRRPYGPRQHPGHYIPPPGHGPPYANESSHSHQFFGPPVPRPPFHGHGPPYTGVPPPCASAPFYGPGPQRVMHAPMYGPNPNQNQMGMYPLLAFCKREWRSSPKRVSPQSESFQILSYNILADYLATEHQNLYQHVPIHYLKWDWRKSKLLFEFYLWSPDILCLQEVDRFPDLQTEMENRGYNGIYKMRTGNAIDGCAIFWRTNRFKLLHHESIQFNEIELRDNVAQICVLESSIQKTPGNDSSSPISNRVVICNIHVLFNPKRGDIKLGQVRTLIDRAYTVSKSWNDAPVVVCGDFNSTPKSPLYNFILEQKLDISGLLRNQISGQESHTRFNSSSETNNNNNNNNNKVTISVEESKLPICSSKKVAQSESIQDNNIITKGDSVINETDNLSLQNSNSKPDDLLKINESLAKMDFGENSRLKSSESDIFKGDFIINEKNEGFLKSSENESDISKDDLVINENEDLLKSSENESDIFKGDFVINETNEDFLKQLHGTKDGYSNNVLIDDKYNNGYYSYKWAPHEIKAATGSEECTVVKHSLKLRSVYTDVEDCAGTKDCNREPEVTSYHLNFMGTVDYIWSSEGLQTVKVLDTIPKQILKQTRGFPTKKWGSDHIALVCQLAFVSNT